MNASAQMAETLRAFRQTHSTSILKVGMDRWEYILGGQGECTIVMIGGGGSTAESMFSINVALESNCQVVSLGIPPSAKTIEEVNRGIAGILDSLGIGQAILLGHSLGGIVAQSFALRHPQRVAGMVLSSTGFYLGARAVLLPAATSLMMRFPEAWLLRAVGSQMGRLLKPAEAADFWLQFYQEELNRPDAGARLKHQGSLLVKYSAFFYDNPIHSGLPWANSLPVQIIAAEDDRGFTKREISSAVSTVLRVRGRPCSASAAAEHCGYGDLEWAAGVCGRCGHSMGIESIFSCNMQNNKELTAEGEKRFRMLWQPIMSAVSHAQRLPRQRLSPNRLSGQPVPKVANNHSAGGHRAFELPDPAKRIC